MQDWYTQKFEALQFRIGKNIRKLHISHGKIAKITDIGRKYRNEIEIEGTCAMLYWHWIKNNRMKKQILQKTTFAFFGSLVLFLLIFGLCTQHCSSELCEWVVEFQDRILNDRLKYYLTFGTNNWTKRKMIWNRMDHIWMPYRFLLTSELWYLIKFIYSNNLFWSPKCPASTMAYGGKVRAPVYSDGISTSPPLVRSGSEINSVQHIRVFWAKLRSLLVGY